MNATEARTRTEIAQDRMENELIQTCVEAIKSAVKRGQTECTVTTSQDYYTVIQEVVDYLNSEEMGYEAKEHIRGSGQYGHDILIDWS